MLKEVTAPTQLHVLNPPVAAEEAAAGRVEAAVVGAVGDVAHTLIDSSDGGELCRRRGRPRVGGRRRRRRARGVAAVCAVATHRPRIRVRGGGGGGGGVLPDEIGVEVARYVRPVVLDLGDEAALHQGVESELVDAPVRLERVRVDGCARGSHGVLARLPHALLLLPPRAREVGDRVRVVAEGLLAELKHHILDALRVHDRVYADVVAVPVARLRKDVGGIALLDV
mmetsp:Transcript_21472/g.52118  ORF Transcript_21472/g.52118 Transcript_21472/m.52118 type:complete len:226 (+) Transcript_21472:281-958(+)